MRSYSSLPRWIVLLVINCVITDTRADLIITGVVDGTRQDGGPQAMELMATTDISDLSDFFILRNIDGPSDGPFTVGSFISLPQVPLSAGNFYYIYGNPATETFLESPSVGFGNTDPGFLTALPDSILNSAGTDIFAVATAGDGTGILDVFGLLGQDGTFAADSIAYRKPNTAANPTGVLDAGNFDLTSYTDLDFTSTFGTYQFVAVPEPTAFLFGGFLASLACMQRSR